VIPGGYALGVIGKKKQHSAYQNRMPTRVEHSILEEPSEILCCARCFLDTVEKSEKVFGVVNEFGKLELVEVLMCTLCM